MWVCVVLCDLVDLDVGGGGVLVVLGCVSMVHGVTTGRLLRW